VTPDYTPLIICVSFCAFFTVCTLVCIADVLKDLREELKRVRGAIETAGVNMQASVVPPPEDSRIPKHNFWGH
jgi:hypothetical protein